MPSICLYFKVHQPFQLKTYPSSDVAVEPVYIDGKADELTINHLADTCYLPANEILLTSILKTGGKFKLSYSISGTTLELLQQYRPDVIDSFIELVNTGCVEILAETYYNSLSYLYSKKEFARQIKKHSALVKSIFGITPSTFRNAELLYQDELAVLVSSLGYPAIFCEGVESILEDRSPNLVYRDAAGADMRLFLRNRNLSDDIAFRFDDRSWNEHPLTAEKFASWIHSHPQSDEVINLFMDYETFGVHKKKETGIFDFLKALPECILSNEHFSFSTPAALCAGLHPSGTYSAKNLISWDNQDLHSCVWSTNRMQNNALKKIYSMEKLVKNSHSESLTDTWAMLQSADYFYSMALPGNHGDSYKYINPFSSSEEIYLYYSNIVTDFEIRLIKLQISAMKKKAPRMETGIY